LKRSAAHEMWCLPLAACFVSPPLASTPVKHPVRLDLRHSAALQFSLSATLGSASSRRAQPVHHKTRKLVNPCSVAASTNPPSGLRAQEWFWPGLCMAAALSLHSPGAVFASGAVLSSGPSGPLTRAALVTRLVMWVIMFLTAALLAGAETAITTLWPWKVKQLATDEGANSPFSVLQNDITRVLTTVLVGVTFCTIFGTALATDIAVQLFGHAGVGYATVAITAVTLLFGEILPKSLAVAQPERLARATLPFITAVTRILAPVSFVTAAFSKVVLRALGGAGEGEGLAITNSELRMILGGASQSGAVELYEQDMIEGVLDLQRSQVQQIMTPRVELVAIDAESSLVDLLALTREYKYSRVPVYNQTIDEITGVVLSRELLEFADAGAGLENVSVASIMDPVEFVPESMTVMNALKQMRRQRLHMMVVVDEFGGTSGVITLEDILETLVGEIYDEDDEVEAQEDTGAIVQMEDGSFKIDGMADLQPTCERLQLDIPEDTLNEFSTLSGYLCHVAGEIPNQDDIVLVSGLRFDVLEADERRLLLVRASNITSATSTEPDLESTDL